MSESAVATASTPVEQSTLRVRRSILDLQKDYEAGNKKPLEDLIRAWKGIQALPPDDKNSFFYLGGLHGEPFRGGGYGNASFWGGYCNHGNVLFPTWHRVYCFKLEEALRSIPDCADVTLPFWDETSADSLANGIPSILTQPTFELDGETIKNPLRSFTLSRAIVDRISNDNPNYSKPVGYETVRYPLSGLVGSPEEVAATEAHNAQFTDDAANIALLNQNVVNWLSSYIVVDGKTLPTNVKYKFETCLDAPNYTVFSNTTSAQKWNDDAATGSAPVVPLESPHNSIHLSVGGFDVPGQGDFSAVAGANGDMGENDTAGLDPIFFFHHCFIDRVFWLWQKKHGFTDHLEIIEYYPGTNSVDNQGPTPGVAANTWLTLDSPLSPFPLTAEKTVPEFTSRDCVNIENQLGYTYGPGSLEDKIAPLALAAEALALPSDGKSMLRVSGINRAAIPGSFLVAAYTTVDGKQQVIGVEAVLSRWHVDGCANCQTPRDAQTHFNLRGIPAEERQPTNIGVKVITRNGTTEIRPQAPGARLLTALPVVGQITPRIEIR